MSVEVSYLTAEREDAYTCFVGAHPDALIYYTLSYRDLLAELLGAKPRYALALRDGAVVGVMPLMSLSGTLGTVLNSLPYFGSIGAPLTGDDEATGALCAWYAEETNRADVVAATVVANPLASRAQSVVHDLADRRVVHVTPLPGGDDDAQGSIWAAIDGSARRNVTKARRRGTTVEVENESFAALESLHRQSMGAIGGQVKGSAFFSAVRRHFRPGADYDVYVARTDGQPVAGLLVFFCSGCADYYVPAVSPEHRGEQPMAAILIKAMTDAAQRGLARWNWGGSWASQESLQRFKAKWGGVAGEYRYETKLNDRGLLRARPDDLLAAYPGFFVVPFSALSPGG